MTDEMTESALIAENCPLCVAEDEFYKENVSSLRDEMKALNERKKAEDDLKSTKDNIHDLVASLRRNTKSLLEDLDDKERQKLVAESARDQRELDFCNKRLPLLEKRVSLLRPLTDSERKKLSDLKEKRSAALAKYAEMEAKHPQCAACGIRLGDGHIMQYVKGNKGHLFCRTCPKVVSKWKYGR